MKQLEHIPYKNDSKQDGGRTVIAIEKTYNHDEIRIHENAEIKIKFEDDLEPRTFIDLLDFMINAQV